ncbi:hypothetical protein HYR99_37220 [Candidatus Poribacteria bacterium]|nr:hypothetical protein [Candidatus Poribacteria bacterium]
MAYYIYTTLSFPCNYNTEQEKAEMCELAQRELTKNPKMYAYARLFLQGVASGSGFSKGNKGYIYTWGGVWNYFEPLKFFDALQNFFRELYHRSFLFDFERVVLLWEEEESESANAYVLAYDESLDELLPQIHKHLPFAWGQY